jgi:multimeric flavodoxin WrbA
LVADVKTLVVSASPREDGNSHILARSAIEGARSAGHDVEHVFLDEYIQRMLGNCRRCRRIEDGSCSLDDGYEDDGLTFAEICTRAVMFARQRPWCRFRRGKQAQSN